MDTENEVTEMETELETNPIESIVDSIIAGDFNNAGDMFNNAMTDRIADALDAKRVEVGTGMSFDLADDDINDIDLEVEESDTEEE
jgi:hypothetical protein